MTTSPRDADPTGTIRTELASRRTSAAYERTLLAWTRTAVSLIGFGFSIPKFFQQLAESTSSRRGGAPGNLGLALIAVGTLSLAGAIAQYQVNLRRLPTPVGRHDRLSISVLMAASVAIFGCYAFIEVVAFAGAR